MPSLKANQSSLDFQNNMIFLRYKAARYFIELKVPRRILNSPDTVAAVNRHKLSPNAFK